VATHPRIAQAARDAGFARVLTCRGTVEEILASIESFA
jgi:uroporphyrinogen-III synthase